MIVCLNQKWVRRCKFLVGVASAITVGTGAVLFLAWVFNLEVLTKFAVDLTPTNPITALGFILVGLALWLLREPLAGRARRRLVGITAGIIVVLGASALVDFALGWALRVDQLTERPESSQAGAPVPYLTAPATALSFLLFGLSLFFLDATTRKGRWPAQDLILITAAVNLLAVAGYYYGPDDLHHVAAFTTETLPSVFLILLLCVAALCARPERGIARVFVSDHGGGVMMRRLLPAAVFVPLLVGWFRLWGERLGLYQQGFGLALFATILILSFIALIWWSSEELNRLDIEARRAAEHLRQANLRLTRDIDFFRGIAEAVPGILFTWNAEGRNTFACPNFYKLTGLLPGSAAGDGWADALHPKDREETLAAWQEALATGSSLDIKHRLRMADGGYHWSITRACALRSESGEIRGWFGVSTDIEEQKRTEEELEAAVSKRTVELQERAEQLTRLTSELTLTEQRERRHLAQVLHDNLQQLLVGAKFNLNVLCRRLSETQRAIVEEVENLLDESISVSRSLTVELSPPILHDAGLAAGMGWLARWLREKRGMMVDLHVDPNLSVEREDVRVLVFEAVRELLLNVVKHAQVDQVRVEIFQQGERELRAVVEDTGVGFDAGRIFQASQQANGGFGLFNVRERLSLVGGQFEIESAPGRGSRITLSVPIQRAINGSANGFPEEDFVPAESTTPRWKGVDSSAGGAIRLLLVDDHAVLRQGIASLLATESDFRIVGEAEDGEKAIELARDLEPDVILMDFSLPKVDGVEATRVIHGELPEIRVIGLSMFEEADRATAMMDAGASAYLSKAGRADALVSAIREGVPPGMPGTRAA